MRFEENVIWRYTQSYPLTVHQKLSDSSTGISPVNTEIPLRTFRLFVPSTLCRGGIIHQRGSRSGDRIAPSFILSSCPTVVALMDAISSYTTAALPYGGQFPPMRPQPFHPEDSFLLYDHDLLPRMKKMPF